MKNKSNYICGTYIRALLALPEQLWCGASAGHSQAGSSCAEAETDSSPEGSCIG